MCLCNSRPERWDDLPNAVSNMPGVWSHLLTFLGGPRACIAYRFAIVEYVLVLHLSWRRVADMQAVRWKQDEGLFVHGRSRFRV
jgi:cytochrome P450